MLHGPDIKDSLEKYATTSNLFDIDVVSTLGLMDEDLEAIKNMEGIDSCYGIKTKDTKVKIEEKESICKIIEYHQNCNTPALIEGRLPENEKECLLDRNYTITDHISNYLGKTIIIENDDVNAEEQPILKQKEFTIVGIVESPLYISNERGNTTIGNGTINFFIYTNPGVINSDYYTEIYSKVQGAETLELHSDAYWQLVNPVISKIEEIKTQREEERYNKLIKEATEKFNDAQKEFEKEKNEINQKFENAEKEINDAKYKIASAEKKLNSSEKEITTQENNGNQQLLELEKKLADGKEQITIKKKELEIGKQEINQKKEEAEQGINQIDRGISEANDNLTKLLVQKEALQKDGLDTSQIDALIKQASETLGQLNTQKTQIKKEIEEAENTWKTGENEIIKAESEWQKQKRVLEINKNNSMHKIAEGKREIENGRKELEKAKQEIKEKEIQKEEQKQETIVKLEEAQKELDQAKDEINKIEKAKWYIRSRKDNLGYTNIIDAIKTITNISKLFPVIFYFVAILISLTSMTRMVEEERTEIGTLKALGYTNFQIMIKYILYAFLASMIGGLLGMSIGFYIIPNIVWNIYDTIYKIPKFYAEYRIGIGILGFLIAFICIGGATIFVATKELKNMPSILMRPKAPKNGKKILLERISCIWKKFNFSKKVTARNIFRYKKRAIMTIVGIAGCTGLMVTGFGLKDSVMDIPKMQYEEIFTYDMSISLSEDKNLKQIEEKIKKDENTKNYTFLCASAGKLKGTQMNYETTILIPEDIEGFEKLCHLKDVDTHEKVKLTDDGIIISDKVAELLKIKKGDSITLIDGDNLEYSCKVIEIVENYVANYIYMTKNFYETKIKSYQTNMILLEEKENEKSEQANELLAMEGVASIVKIEDAREAINDMLNSLNYVVIILIVASALLAFVVLYNLANINIGERQREIATLKVLGFYDKEVDNYINKENLIFTGIGILLGLIFGYFLTDIIIASVEIDKLRFIRNIRPESYVYATIITIVFSLIVNHRIHFILKKINMIESLKSVE